MTDKEYDDFWEHCRKAAATVNSWPDWKKNCLGTFNWIKKEEIMRENGFYWVKFRGELTVGEWFKKTKTYTSENDVPGYWTIMGYMGSYSDDQMEEISRRIEGRLSGFYKIKLGSQWCLARYDNRLDKWFDVTTYNNFDNKNIKEIGERIELP